MAITYKLFHGTLAQHISVFLHLLQRMQQAFDGIIYDTNTSTLIARNELPDTIKYLKGHRNRYLYRTPDGAYFLYKLTESYFGAVSDPDPSIKPLTKDEAMEEYQYLW